MRILYEGRRTERQIAYPGMPASGPSTAGPLASAAACDHARIAQTIGLEIAPRDDSIGHPRQSCHGCDASPGSSCVLSLIRHSPVQNRPFHASFPPSTLPSIIPSMIQSFTQSPYSPSHSLTRWCPAINPYHSLLGRSSLILLQLQPMVHIQTVHPVTDWCESAWWNPTDLGPELHDSDSPRPHSFLNIFSENPISCHSAASPPPNRPTASKEDMAITAALIR